MKILVVEAGPKTGNDPKQGRTEAGFVVDLVRYGNDDLHAAVTEAHELIALDASLLRRGKATEPEVVRVVDMELDQLRRPSTRSGGMMGGKASLPTAMPRSG